MSQRKFNSGKFEVMAGWDRPLQQVFFAVFDPTRPAAEDDLVYASMYERNGPRTVETVLAKMVEMGIVPPARLAADLHQDQADNVGNLQCSYSAIE